MNRARQTPAEDLFDRMRRADETILNQSRFVTINTSRVIAFAEALPPVHETELLDDRHHYINPANCEGSLAFLFALEAVNFGGTYSRLLADEGMDLPDGLYLTTARRLKGRFEQATLGAAEMAQATPEACAALFGFHMDQPSNKAMADLYAKAWTQTGSYVQTSFRGSFQDVLYRSNDKTENFIQILRSIPRFDDTYAYPLPEGKTLEVPILKNAQHLAGSLSLACPRLGLPAPFEDTEKLTAFPDNKIAHVLWVDGILEFSEDLSRAVLTGTPIPVGSPEEIEIRIGARHAVRLLTEYANSRGLSDTPLRQIDVDHRIWHASHGNSVLMTGKAYRDTPCFRTADMTCHY